MTCDIEYPVHEPRKALVCFDIALEIGISKVMVRVRQDEDLDIANWL
jgi:hypothetical protein